MANETIIGLYSANRASGFAVGQMSDHGVVCDLKTRSPSLAHLPHSPLAFYSSTPLSFSHLLTHSPTESLTHSRTHSLIHPPTHSLAHSLTEQHKLLILILHNRNGRCLCLVQSQGGCHVSICCLHKLDAVHLLSSSGKCSGLRGLRAAVMGREGGVVGWGGGGEERFWWGRGKDMLSNPPLPWLQRRTQRPGGLWAVLMHGERVGVRMRVQIYTQSCAPHNLSH